MAGEAVARALEAARRNMGGQGLNCVAEIDGTAPAQAEAQLAREDACPLRGVERGLCHHAEENEKLNHGNHHIHI